MVHLDANGPSHLVQQLASRGNLFWGLVIDPTDRTASTAPRGGAYYYNTPSPFLCHTSHPSETLQKSTAT